MKNRQQIQYQFVKMKDKGWFSTSIDFDQLTAQLNNLGAEGWDVVTGLDINTAQGRTKEVVLLLKKYV